ncbi:MAG TPA: 5'-3' exonuclease H3TH domain-containing protein [Candidatus Levybacteria bacterium]|nr:5'-3' exonuclease H3TH domain-containing protein [Candidatus Levybacteria bacterium]
MERPNGKKIFMIIDGSAILYRAFHAMPNLTSPEGIPTGALSGFFSMLLKLMQHVQPDYLAVAFDRGKPTFRQQMYVGYHANRPKAPDELKDQFASVRETLAAIGIPVYEIDGFEGDDLVGSINQKLNEERQDLLVYIVTGDRDMLQLVDDDTRVLMPVKGISEVMIFDTARVIEKYGIRPDQVVDLKAFMGDASDNYPGVPGVGPKTAMNLLLEYEHFETVFEKISEIEAKNPKLATKLAENADQAFMAKKLATIDTHVPFVFSFEECDVTLFTKEKFTQAFKKYSFNTLTKRLDDVFENNGNSKAQMKLI